MSSLTPQIAPEAVRSLQSERDVTKTIVDFLKASGWRIHRLQSGTVRGMTGGRPITLNPKGTPDWLALRPRLGLLSSVWEAMVDHLYLEVKRPGGKLRPAQAAMHIALRQDGFTVIVADSFDRFRAEYDSRFRQ